MTATKIAPLIFKEIFSSVKKSIRNNGIRDQDFASTISVPVNAFIHLLEIKTQISKRGRAVVS